MADTQSPTQRFGGLLAVSVVFLLGVICGAALLFVGSRFLPEPPPFGGRGRDRGERMAIARMARDLDLDARQREQVRAVIERSRVRVEEILEQSRGEIRGLLRPDQQERLDRMRPPRPPLPRRGPGGPPPD